MLHVGSELEVSADAGRPDARSTARAPGMFEGTATATPFARSTVTTTVILTPISLELVDQNGVVLEIRTRRE